MNIVILIPTYNESENVGMLLDCLFMELGKIKYHNFNVLIIDGQSTDTTRDIINSKKKSHINLNLIIEKEKNGLGSAYLFGINYALKNLNADAILEFDGDFQHDPKDIYRLVEKLDQGYEHIIGSRYIPGGTIPTEWPWYRKFLSNAGNIIIRTGLNVPTHDNTSGFKLTRMKLFKHVLPLKEGQLLSLRHAYKIHFLHSLTIARAKTVEVPITFLNRNKGISKSTIEDIIESLKVVFLLRINRFKTTMFKNK